METISIERMTYGIDALGHLEDGKVVFVPYAAPGDEVTVNVTEDHPDYCKGEIVEIVTPSAERRPSPCPNFPACGGCHWQHLNAEAQRREKETSLRFMLNPLQPRHMYPMEALPMRNYRNKMELKVAIKDNEVILGNYMYRSHDVVSIKGCFVQCNENMALYDKLCELMNIPEMRQFAETVSTITVRTLRSQQNCNFYINQDPSEEVLNILKAFFDETQELGHLEVTTKETRHLSLHRQHPLFEFMGKSWYISPESFFQNNLEGAEAILHTLISIYEGNQFKGKFLDLYCGCGVQTFLLEPFFDEVYAVECNESSYRDAMAYKDTKPNSRIRFICKRVEAVFGTPMTRGNVAAVHLNPPRTGCSQRVIRGLASVKPRMMTYLSCNPMTFRRDAKAFRQMGYKLDSVYSFDLFPGTFHLETLGVFVR